MGDNAVLCAGGTDQKRPRAWPGGQPGQLPAGKDWAGKRLGVFVDGGRTKIRTVTKRQKGQGKHKTQRRRYRADGREPKLRVTKTLDWCHAVHHISLALEPVVEDKEVRRRLFKKFRKWLKQGDWWEVVLELAKLAKDLPQGHALWTELDYLDRHGEEGHLDYAKFRRRGVPLGSGAIESAIRRVINLRLKGNSISW